MFLNVMKDGLGTMSCYTWLLKRTQQNQQYLFKLFHILTTNKIKYVLYDDINVLYDKSPNFVELMLESWIFFIKNVVWIRIIKLIFLIIKLHSKDLERSIGNVGAKKESIWFFNSVLALQMKVCHLSKCFVIMHSFFIILEQNIQNLFNWFESFTRTLINWKLKHTYAPYIV